MTGGPQNHYRVLKLERTADERAVKKAYFTLIREFTPDAHPEEFKRIREAYEVLSDPVARQRFDDADKDFEEYGSEIAAELRDLEVSIKAGNEPDVQKKARALLETKPELAMARESLAFSFMRTKAFKEALGEFTKLSKGAPEEARYHLYRGLALNRLEQSDKAVAAVTKARELKPSDAGIQLALIDLLLGRKELDLAISEIDDALSRQEPQSQLAMTLCLRKIDGHFTLGELSDGQAEVTALFARIGGVTDPELPKYVAAQLAAIAANLFARSQPDRANALLLRCAEIHPEGQVNHPFPAVAELDARDLSAEAQQWLASRTPGPQSPTLGESIWPANVALFLGGCAAAGGVLYLLFDAPERWSAGDLGFTAVACAGICAVIALAVRGALSTVKSALRAFTTVHPLYLVRARGDRLKVFPLFRITNVRGVHHHTNGAYTHTAIVVSCGREVLNLSVRGQQYAQGWLDYLSSARRRALELMAEGYLEAEYGVDLIPPAMLTRGPARSDARKRRFQGVTAGCALAIFAVLVPLRAWKADDHAYRLAVRSASVEAYSVYLGAYPSGRHAEQARRAIAQRFERTGSALTASGNLTLGSALDALRAAGVVTVPLSITSTVELPKLSTADWADASQAFAATPRSAREQALFARLERSVEAAGIADVLRFVPPRDDAPVTLTIKSATKPGGGVLRAEGLAPIPAIVIEWEAVISVRGNPTPLYRFIKTTQAPPEVRLGSAGDERELGLLSDLFAQVEDAGFDAFAADFAEHLGLPDAPPLVRAPSLVGARKPRSPYERR